MKWLFLLTPLLLSSSFSWGQPIKNRDSIEVMKAVDVLFELFEKPDLNALEKISTDKIYCLICSDLAEFNGDYLIDRKDFFENHLNKIRHSDSFKLATKSKDIVLHNTDKPDTDIIVFITVYQANEIAPGHEGGQLGIHLKKVNGKFKFAGMETIP